jgi:P27 family predicted phage terminase small subunit
VQRGRKPKPSHLRLIGGNAGRRPINSREPSVALATPPPPPELNDDAKKEWARVAPMLGAAGLLTPIDRAALAALCQAYGVWVLAERALARMAAHDPVTNGLLIKTTNGNAIQNPLVGIANKARADLVRFAAEFGMTPSARSRVHADPNAAAKAQDPARKYF